ncbi:DUF1501 domain-containing protein [Pseudokineococcus basanitobsidens]|uniref:DUF1501 domain-containing protein n=1 Tax=Pseudokineococcus basanitobsidens TaxID=1926649 RepID=A0ABU8RNT7_9ACTN
MRPLLPRPRRSAPPRPAAPACGCAEDRAAGLSRRSLLAGALAGGLALTVGDASTQVALAEPGYDGDALVVLSLRGGLDGLSAVAPVGDPSYAALRPRLAVPPSVAHRLDGVLGLHPALGPLMPLWTAGSLAVLHAVGMAQANRSHFSAMEEMERAAPGTTLRTGWLDRMVGGTGAGSVFAAVQAGGSRAAASLRGPTPELAFGSLAGLRLRAGADGEEPRRAAALRALHAGAPAALAAPATTALDAVARTGALLAARPTPPVAYPASDLGRSLRDVATLVRGGAGVRAAAVDVGDWDMHVGMGSPTDPTGWMHRKLTDLALSLVAFAADLGPSLDRVVLVTLSEFGRTADENGSGGTDHGYGNAVLVLGGGVVGGRVHGRWPGLAPADRVGGDLAVTTDYRSLLAEALVARCGLSPATAFPGAVTPTSGVFRKR